MRHGHKFIKVSKIDFTYLFKKYLTNMKSPNPLGLYILLIKLFVPQSSARYPKESVSISEI